MKTQLEISVFTGEVTCHTSFLILGRGGEIIAASFFDRSSTTVGQADSSLKASARHGGTMSVTTYTDSGRYIRKQLNIYKGDEYVSYRTQVPFGHDKAAVSFAYNKGIGTKYLITTFEKEKEDFYSFLMSNYQLPLLKEWVPYLMEQMENRGYLYNGGERAVMAPADTVFRMQTGDSDEWVNIHSLIIYECYMNEETLESIVTQGIAGGYIRITDKPQKPLVLGEMDNETRKYELNAYMETYGSSLNKNVDAVVNPLVPLEGVVPGFAAKNRRLYPQQAAVVNGMIALADNNERFALMSAGMGCGKTMMGIATVEGRENQKWLKNNKGKSLKDMYLSPESMQPKYRAVVMPPGHLLEKWKREILREVPNARVKILRTLADLEELRRQGKEPDGREWYIIGKDFAKLDSGVSPIPYQTAVAKPGFMICKGCHEKGDFNILARDHKGRGYCTGCGTHNKEDFEYFVYPNLDATEGLVCPDCGHLLIKKKAKPTGEDIVLTPYDFADKNSDNDFCRHCGASLWGYRVKPNDGHKEELKWVKVAYKLNKNGKGTSKSSYVMRGRNRNGVSYFDQFVYRKGMLDQSTGKPAAIHEVHVSEQQYYPRKVAPATFIKKYLKGFFNYCLLDEIHKYAGAGTAQMQAAHALVKVSKFTLGLTGTLTNGKADSLYYLFWMLMPRTLVKKGFTFGSSLEFSKQYGCIETICEEAWNNRGNYAKLSRGRQLSSPSVKPGINPIVYSEFLLGHSVNMDLADLSSQMPALVESVELVEMPEDVSRGYTQTISVLRDATRQNDGKCLLGETLNYALSYPDKPYGREMILHPHSGEVVAGPCNCDKYRNTLMPKEERLVEIVKAELNEGRNVVVFAYFTGKEETNVTSRLQNIIEEECNIRGRVTVLEANKPKAEEREAYIHNKARMGMQVMIANAKVCETGLDFVWEEDGILYNYPSIVFYQPSYELQVLLQASRRHYRLNQTVECRTYWMAYDGTLQAAALQIMASKQVAAAAIQGKFSAEGLASMAQGVDPRVMLAKKLADGDNSSREELSGMFDVLAKNNQREEVEEVYEKQPLYFEIMGEDYTDEALEAPTEISDDLFSTVETVEVAEVEQIDSVAVDDKPAVKEKKTRKSQKYDGLDSFFDIGFEMTAVSIEGVKPFAVTSKKSKIKVCEGQMDLLSLLAS